MQRTRRSTQEVCVADPTRTASLDVPTNNAEVSPWGNGFTAQGVTGPDGGSGVGTSFRGIAQDLTAPAYGYSPGRTWDSWMGGGLGASYGGTYGAGPYSRDAGVGVGVGGGGGHFSEVNGTRTSEGYGGGLAVGGRIDSNETLYGQQFGYGGDIYRGVGGTGYEFSDSKTGRSGYGVSGGYTPFGLNDGYVRTDGALGSHEVSAGSAEYGRVGGQLEGFSTADGGWGMTGGLSTGRNTARDVRSHHETALGTTDASIGQIGQGRYYEGTVGQDGDGRFYGQYKKGGSLTVNDAAVSHDWGNGMNTSASLGRYGGNSSDYNLGFNPNTGAVDFHGTHATGKRWNDVAVSSDLPGGGHVAGSMGQFQTGSAYRIDPGSHIGPDGVHVSGGGYGNDGVEVKDVAVAGGYEGIAEYEASMGRFSNRTTVDGAKLDIDGSGVHAGVDRVRTGGMIMEDMAVRQEVLGVNSAASLGEFSNDTLVNGARLDVDGSGVHAGFDEVDFGGIRLKDAAYETDLGGLADVNASMGSFTNGNNIKGGALDITGDGVRASVEEFGVNGTDINDVRVGVDGPGGSYANAEMGAYHSGITGRNAYAEINGDGFSAGAERLGYDQHSVRDVSVNGGIEGIYEANASLGEGYMNRASADNVALTANGDGVNLTADRAAYTQYGIENASIESGIPGVYGAHASLGKGTMNAASADNIAFSANGDGISASADNLSYSYLGVEDFRAGQNFGDGAVTTELELGRGSYLGAGADHAEFQGDLLNSSGSVDGLNAHGLKLEDLNAGVTVGDAGVNVGAEQLNVLDLNVGHADFQRTNGGLQASGNISDAQLDVINAEGLGGGLTYGDQTIAAAHTDLNLSAGVEDASARYDLMAGTASGEFTNANASLMTDNTRLEAFGMGVDIGRTGAEINASGSGAVDVMAGQASGNVNFAGSELALFGHSVEVGDWAQASGAVDVTQGAANFNVGGENGVGADMNLAEGNLDINAFGTTIDVDQGIRDAGTAIADGASWAGDRLSDAGSAISSGASKAWDAVTSW